MYMPVVDERSGTGDGGGGAASAKAAVIGLPRIKGGVTSQPRSQYTPTVASTHISTQHDGGLCPLP